MILQTLVLSAVLLLGIYYFKLVPFVYKLPSISISVYPLRINFYDVVFPSSLVLFLQSFLAAYFPIDLLNVKMSLLSFHIVSLISITANHCA